MSKRGETAAILPSDSKGRKQPMTDEEFEQHLIAEQRRLLDAGRPLVDPDWRERIASSKGGVAKQETE